MNLLLCFLSLIVSVLGVGEISFFQSPGSVEFSGNEGLNLSTVSDVISRAYGFSIRKSSDWSGMSLKDPFSFAEAVVCIVLPGISGLNVDQGQRYDLNTDLQLDDVWNEIYMNIEERHADQNPILSKVVLGDEGEVLTEETRTLFSDLAPSNEVDYKLKYLMPERKVDQVFLKQLNQLKAVSKIVSQEVTPDGVPDSYWFVVRGMYQLVNKYGAESKPVHEAKRLIVDRIMSMSEDFSNIYNGKVLFAVIASDESVLRRWKRETLATGVFAQFEQGDDEYSEDYPAIFNIFLWLTMSFVFSLIAVAISIMKMDPGRDSIIYRMTSNRMKKDN